MFKIFRPVLFLTVLVLLLTVFTIPASSQEGVYVIDNAVYNDVDAGLELGLGPSGAIDILQEALDEHHPDWGQEENLASDAWSYSHAQNIGVSPRVLLAVTGVALDWQIPENHNLKEAIIQTGIALTQHYREFRFNEEVQANHPEVADAANYALYAFFDYDLEKLDAWQQEYDLMFGEIQSRQGNGFSIMSESFMVDQNLEPFMARPFRENQALTPFYTVNSFLDHETPYNRTEVSLTRFDGEVLPDGDVLDGTEHSCIGGISCYSGHEGLDYSTGGGVPIYPVANGIISVVVPECGQVEVLHQAQQIVTVYMHMENLQFTEDDENTTQVTTETLLGDSGDVDDNGVLCNSGGAHLHFHVRSQNDPQGFIDPYGWWASGELPDPLEAYTEGGGWSGSSWLWKGDENEDGYLTVDNRESQAQLFNLYSWWSDSGGYDGEAWWTYSTADQNSSTNWAIWGVNIEQPGIYQIQAYWPADPDWQSGPSPTKNATYTLYYHDIQGGIQSITLYGDQSRNANQFNTLCAVPYGNESSGCPEYPQIQFGTGSSVLILQDVTGEASNSMVFFDAIRWQEYVPPPSCTTWNIATDFRIAPNQENPNSDSCGNAGVWEFMGSENPNYQLPTFTSNIGGYTGLDFWFGTHIDGNGSFPAIGFNGSGETRVFGAITFPVNAVNIHPAPVQSGVIAWHSPVSGHVSISGGVSDNDPACGNGIVWYLDKNTIDLASGGIVNGGSQSFANGSGGTELGTVEVNIGDTIYLAIHSNGDYFCDNTKVDFIVDVTNAPPTPTPLGGPTSTSFPPNYTPLPSTETPFPTPTPPTIQPTSSPYVQCYCVIDFLVYLEIELPCWLLGSNNLKLAAPLPVFQSTQQAILDVQLFHRVEDEILSQTPQGEEYIALYYEYSPEIIQILYNDPALKQEAIEVLQMWEPNLQALVDGEGNTVTISNAQVLAVETFLNNLSAQASPELQQVIANEQIQQPLEQFSGVTMSEALVYVEDGLSETPTPTSTSTPTVTPSPTAAPDLIFADGFESGNFSAWDGANTDSGDLSVTTSAAYQSGFGLQARLDDTVNLKAVDFSPTKETRYRARFYFHPNSIAMNAGSAHFIFDGFNQGTGSTPLFRLELIYENGTYKLRQHVITDNNVYAKGIKIAISNDWHAVEIEWNKASATGANDGAMFLWVDGALVDVISNVDNDSAIHLLEKIYLGATGSIDPTTSGSMFFDDFISHRETFIGQ